MAGEIIAQAIHHLFAENKFVQDRREACASFVAWDHYKVSLVMLDVRFIIQILFILGIQIAVSTLLAVVTYYYIIKSASSQTRFLIGFGLIIPTILYTPFPIIEVLDIQSRTTRLGLIAGPLTVSLKCLEAMYGFTPQYATTSLHAFIQHAGFILYPIMDRNKKTQTATLAVKATVSSILRTVRLYLVHTLLNGIIYSILLPYNFMPFEASRVDTDIFVTLEWTQLLNSFTLACLLSLSLHFSNCGIDSLVQLIGGFQTESVVDNPMFASRSVSEFWGVRWNKLIHRGLKQGVYKPIIRATNSRAVAAMSAFLMSGLAHEYVWIVMFYVSSHEEDPYVPPVGKTMLFFAWNGVLIMMEYAIGTNRWNATFRAVPSFIMSFLVALLALPVAHLFLGDFRVGGYFHSIVHAFPIILVEKL